MEERYRVEAKIRKIIVGGQKDGFHYEVGKYMPNAGFTVHEILFNETHYDFFKEVRYEIYVEKNKEISLWKHFVNLPLIIEYFV